jgi:hypothetical protein
MTLMTWILVSLCAPGVALADHDLTWHPDDNPPPGGGSKGGNVEFEWKVEEGESMELVLGLTAGGAAAAECSAQLPGLVPLFLPLNTPAVVRRHTDVGGPVLYWSFGPLGEAPLASFGHVADLPAFTTPDGTPLFTHYNESDLAFILRSARTFAPGEILSASTGAIPGWPAATILELPPSFTLEDLISHPAGLFPEYTGAVQVANVAEITAIPEPSSLMLLLLAGATLAIAKRRRRY